MTQSLVSRCDPGGTNWNASAWPTSSVGTADATTWRYEPATGLLTNKLYADGQGPRFAYTADGLLYIRTWARGVATTCRYDLAGAVTNIAYSDTNTPGVSIAYDRLGRPNRVTDVAGTRTFAYTAALLPESETIQWQAAMLPAMTSTVRRTYDGLGRSSGYTVAIRGTNPVASAGYAYEGLGRLSTVTWSNALYRGTGVYSYVAQSDLVEQLAMMNGQVTLKRAYEPNRDVLRAVTNAYSGTAFSSFAYGVDALARRTNRLDAGTQYTPMVTNLFRYNDRNEVTNAVMTTNRVAWSYAYDPIGNRTQTTNTGGGLTNWYANSLNQYTGVVGAATNRLLYDADGNVTNDGVYVYVWDAENRLSAVWQAALPLNSRKAVFAYDWMGRRVRKATWYYVPGRTFYTIETNLFIYDAPSSSGSGAASWNPVAEVCNSPFYGIQATNFYTWGLDIAEQQGAGLPRHSAPGATAGGIGGLLSVTRPSAAHTRLFCYDGNGNVSDLVSTSGAVAVHYDYDAYGVRTRTTGSDSITNFFRFSTKYWDDESGLGNWGRRYYRSDLGRWISRDPMGERGGVNTYCYVRNRPCDTSDPIGLDPQPSYPSCCPREDVLAEARKMALAAAQLTAGYNFTKEMVQFPNASHLYTVKPEFGGYVCCNKQTQKVDHTEPETTTKYVAEGVSFGSLGIAHDLVVKGETSQVNFDNLRHKCSDLGGDWKEAARYHSHPTSSSLSQNDLDLAGNKQEPVAMANSAGQTQVALPSEITTTWTDRRLPPSSKWYGEGYRIDASGHLALVPGLPTAVQQWERDIWLLLRLGS